MNKKDQDEMMDYLWKMAARWVGYRNWEKDGYPMNPPKKLTLGGTPFNHAIVAAMELLPKYKKKTGVEKLNAVFLTDGASHKISNKYIVDGDIDTQSETKAFDSYSNDKIMVITDPVTNTTITEEEVINKISRYSYDSSSQTTMLLQLLKKRVPDTSILGFYVAGSGKAGYVKKEIIMKEMNCSWEEASEYYKEINKNKVLVSKQKGYDEYYILPGGAKLDIESGDLNVEVGASKANLKRAFVKASKGKVTSRILLNKFIQRVA
jgi:predicted transcriptional regulator